MATQKIMAKQMDESLAQGLRGELKSLLDGGQAHTTFDRAVEAMPVRLRGVTPEGLPYSAWQIVEHIRIAQRDILDYCRNQDGSYKPKKWPQDYWPKKPAPPSTAAWDKSIKSVRADRTAFEKLLDKTSDEDLIKPFAWGEGQTLLREALLIADHAAYHTGELIIVRRLLGAWK
jgi:hypothetical protein